MILLEASLARIFALKPNMSEKWAERLSRNAWWIVLVVTVIYAFLFIGALSFVSSYLQYATSNFFASSGSLGYLYTAAFALNMIIFFASTILIATSIIPLRGRQRAGWSRLYVFTLLQLLGQVLLPFVFTILFVVAGARGGYVKLDIADFIDLIVGLIVIGGVMYLLFQARSRFIHGKNVTSA